MIGAQIAVVARHVHRTVVGLWRCFDEVVCCFLFSALSYSSYVGTFGRLWSLSQSVVFWNFVRGCSVRFVLLCLVLAVSSSSRGYFSVDLKAPVCLYFIFQCYLWRCETLNSWFLAVVSLCVLCVLPQLCQFVPCLKTKNVPFSTYHGIKQPPGPWFWHYNVYIRVGIGVVCISADADLADRTTWVWVWVWRVSLCDPPYFLVSVWVWYCLHSC